mmetsp:Transcript_64124/g.202866  ORF Transcript_64124/g.202866 Transcript_64124/m.202866 type:complete len:387 (-) Transcript_64124:135-1295(-)
MVGLLRAEEQAQPRGAPGGGGAEEHAARAHRTPGVEDVPQGPRYRAARLQDAQERGAHPTHLPRLEPHHRDVPAASRAGSRGDRQPERAPPRGGFPRMAIHSPAPAPHREAAGPHARPVAGPLRGGCVLRLARGLGGGKGEGGGRGEVAGEARAPRAARLAGGGKVRLQDALDRCKDAQRRHQQSFCDLARHGGGHNRGARGRPRHARPAHHEGRDGRLEALGRGARKGDPGRALQGDSQVGPADPPGLPGVVCGHHVQEGPGLHDAGEVPGEAAGGDGDAGGAVGGRAAGAGDAEGGAGVAAPEQELALLPCHVPGAHHAVRPLHPAPQPRRLARAVGGRRRNRRHAMDVAQVPGRAIGGCRGLSRGCLHWHGPAPGPGEHTHGG